MIQRFADDFWPRLFRHTAFSTLFFVGPTLLGCQGMPNAPQPAEAPYREATTDERYACEMSTLRGEPPKGGDCSKVPTSGPITEDDPFGRWDCETMGNRVCGPNVFYTPAEAESHNSFNALRKQMVEKGEWGMSPEEEKTYREEFVQNDLSDPNRGRDGYLQAEDGSWVPESFYE